MELLYKFKKICPFELLINRNNNNFSSLQKIFKTLTLDNIRPEIFIDTYISAKKNNNIDYFVLCMTELFMSHKVNNALSEGQSIKSARTQTVARLLALSFSDSEKTEVIKSYVGQRKNRRHKPGRGMERSFYRFDVLSDFGSFRDLQRHRMLTIDWQRLGVKHGYLTPPAIREVGWSQRWDDAMRRISDFYAQMLNDHGPEVAQYVVPFAFKIRYSMQFNVREAFHILELRTAQQGHPDYRRVCQQMHTLIRDKAGHKALADAMSYVDHGSYSLERLEAERKAENRRSVSAD